MDMEIPLSFSISADVFGLQVIHELPDEISM